MCQHRQLAAILFTDIEGYSAVMQQSEQNAVILRDRHREILHKGHDQFNGRIIQFYGDGSLSIFQSAVEAVLCALTMQQAFCQLPLVPVRMGLHIGDIIITDDQVIGDGVNLAARVESLGVAGSVLLSDRVNDEISNHPELKTISTGTYQFKNITRAVELFALQHEGLVQPVPGTLKGKTAEAPHAYRESKKRNMSWLLLDNQWMKSVAVMPFINLTNEPEQDLFSAGMREEILNALTHIKQIKVAGRIPSFPFKGKRPDLCEVGNRLGVHTVLEGSIRKQRNKIRITAQLISVANGYHLWSERFDRDLDDIFSLQDEIATAICKKIKLTFRQNGKAKLHQQLPTACGRKVN
jgi:TolB-like protein